MNLPGTKVSYSMKKFEDSHKLQSVPYLRKYRVARDDENYDIKEILGENETLYTLSPNTRSGCSGTNCKVGMSFQCLSTVYQKKRL